MPSQIIGDGIIAVDLEDEHKVVTDMFDSCQFPYASPPIDCECVSYAAAVADSVEDIMSYIIFTYFPAQKAIEIFVGTCTSAYDTKRIIYGIVNTFADAINMWVYINIHIDAEKFTDVSDYLVHNMFSEADIVERTVLSNRTIPIAAMRFVLDKENLDDYDPKYLEYVIGLREMYVAKLGTCRFKVVIPRHVLEKIKTYLLRDVEYGGIFVIRSYTLEKVGNTYIPVATLGYPLSSETSGEFEGVDTPPSKFNFHTHPYHCYVKYGCAVGWPSDTDISNIPYARHTRGKNIGHFVISVEGVYSIQVTPAFQVYLENMYKTDFMNYEDCHRLFIEKIRSMFNYLNGLRGTGGESHIKKYVDYINSVKISTILADDEIVTKQRVCTWLKPSLDFNMYSISYMSWKNIERNDAFSLLIKDVDDMCPPSIMSDINKIGPGEFL